MTNVIKIPQVHFKNSLLKKNPTNNIVTLLGSVEFFIVFVTFKQDQYKWGRISFCVVLLIQQGTGTSFT